MNPFQKMIDDVFKVPEFAEKMTVNENQEITFIRYSSSEAPIYTEFGTDAGRKLQITVKCKDYSPKKGDRIRIKNKNFRVEDFDTDSFELTTVINLKGER